LHRRNTWCAADKVEFASIQAFVADGPTENARGRALPPSGFTTFRMGFHIVTVLSPSSSPCATADVVHVSSQKMSSMDFNLLASSLFAPGRTSYVRP